MLFAGVRPAVATGDAPVLVIDDQLDSRLREATAQRFAGWGFGVLVAQDAGAALALCGQVIPALIVLGEINYCMDASELLHELKALLGELAPPVSIVIGGRTTASRAGGAGQPTTPMSISPPIALDDLLDFSDSALAA